MLCQIEGDGLGCRVWRWESHIIFMSSLLLYQLKLLHTCQTSEWFGPWARAEVTYQLAAASPEEFQHISGIFRQHHDLCYWILTFWIINYNKFLFYFFKGLSHLVAASFTEDQFGVVQTTLPAILNTLLTLQEVKLLTFPCCKASLGEEKESCCFYIITLLTSHNIEVAATKTVLLQLI